MSTNSDACALAKEFSRVLDEARRKDETYYFINLFDAWHRVEPLAKREYGRTSDFAEPVTTWTNEFIFKKIRTGTPHKAHEMLLLFQLNLEAKYFYAKIRNFLRICLDDDVKPSHEPWLSNEWTKMPGLKLGALIKNIIREFRDSGFGLLADEFQERHTGDSIIIRNAVAHATFHLPSDETDQMWVFGNYERSPCGEAVLILKRYSHDEVVAIFQGVFGFRAGFHAAVQQHRDAAGQEVTDITPHDPEWKRGILGLTVSRGQAAMVQKQYPPAPKDGVRNQD